MKQIMFIKEISFEGLDELFKLRNQYVYFTDNFTLQKAGLLFTNNLLKFLDSKLHFIKSGTFRIQYYENKFIKITDMNQHKQIKINSISDFQDMYVLEEYIRFEQKLYSFLGLQYNINFSEFHSIGKRIEILYKKLKLNEIFPRIINQDKSMFYGGRMELAYQGKYKGKLYDYDLNSAYGSAMMQLKGYKEIRKVYRYIPGKQGVYYVSWKLFTRFHKFVPFLQRVNGILYPVQQGTGFITSYELEIYTQMYGWKGIKIHYGLIAGKEFDTNILKRIIVFVYQERKRNIMLERVLKKFIVVMYGKFAQSSYKYKNYFVASLITGRVRSELIKIICNRKYEKSIIQVMIDGFTSTKRVNVDISNKIGNWKVRVFEQGIFIKEGIYKLDSITKTQGFNGAINFNKLLGKKCIDTEITYLLNGKQKTDSIKFSVKAKRLLSSKVPTRGLRYLPIPFSKYSIQKEYSIDNLLKLRLQTKHNIKYTMKLKST